MISSIQWAVDEDSLTILLKLIMMRLFSLTTLRNSSNDLVVCGRVYRNKLVEHTGKWNESNWVTCNEYLPYCAGPGYVLGSKLVHLLAKYGHFLARDFKSEDAAMGLWLAPFHLQLQHDPLFAINPSCDMNSYTIHQSYRFEVVANRLIKSGTLCSWSEKLQRMWFL